MRPLDDIKVLDLTRLAPGPHCTMVLADLGADVLKIEEVADPSGRRAQQGAGRTIDFQAIGFLDPHDPRNPLNRGKRSIGLNLKSQAGRRIFLQLAEGADIVVEEFRPGVAQRLGIDYPTLQARNRRLIYCAITGYGQAGPWATVAGHDINYLSMAGLLSHLGPAGGPPVVPRNLVADYAGGALQGVIGILAALVARQRTGEGQFVDVSMTEGTLSLLGAALAFKTCGGQGPARGCGALDGAAPFYGVYATRDERWLSVGAIEPWFFANLCRALDLPQLIDLQFSREHWPTMRRTLADVFVTRTRDEWCSLLSAMDTCVTPVLDLDEVADHPQHRARGALVDVGLPGGAAITQVAPTPRLSATPASISRAAPHRYEHSQEVLESLGYDKAAIESLRGDGVVR
jgi:crotonobetainyl-CoA:carnitine CoA-transferase CaiB-like acyl-CoA transferase